MTNKEKEKIRQQLEAYCRQKGSQNRAANTLVNVSAATLSQILANNWELISDDMWRSVAAQIAYDPRTWNIATTQAYTRMTFLLQNAQDDALVMAVTGAAGSGKTEAIRNYARTHKNVFHLCCSEYWNRRKFLDQLLRAMGVSITSTTVSDMMDDAITALKRRQLPLIVLDEADKLSDSVLYFFITLYNQLEDHCGIILCATDFLDKRLRRSLRQQKKGFEEIYSRIGRKCLRLQIINGEDVAAVCTANGISDSRIINRIIDESECDLRKVKRLVWAQQKKASNTET
jgi:DNA transposition AAA+ family ATPase